MKKQFLDKNFETRAALDIGSAQTKITVADVDVRSNKIVHIHHQSLKCVFLRKDLAMSSDMVLSKSIQSHLIDTLKEMQLACSIYNPVKWIAAGTSVFRQAENSLELIAETEKATGIKIQIISQAEEAVIGFHSALGASKEDKVDIISLDAGSGSFQISTWIKGNLHMYGCEIGSQSVYDALFHLRNEVFSSEHGIYPVTEKEVLGIANHIKSKLPKVPEWLLQNDRKVIAIGSGDILPLAWQKKKNLELTSDDLMKFFLQIIEKDRKDIQDYRDPNSAIILILYYALMEHCGIHKIHYHLTNGGCEGLLTLSQYWLKHPI